MKLLFLARKATRNFLNSHHNRLHGGSRPRFHHGSGPMGWSKSTTYLFHSPSFLSVQNYSTSKILNATDSKPSWTNFNNNKKVNLEIISREQIKPASPTPYHLRIYKLSVIDQVIYDMYPGMILFLPNTNKASVMDVFSIRSKQLKGTLAQILTQFYPFAGEVKDNVHIECNDKGVNYMEARVNQTLQDFLCSQDDEKVRELLPESPRSTESSIGNYVIGIQVNIFSCGGIALSTSLSHKIVDFHTYLIFMKAWAAAVRGSPKTFLPCFEASELFPNDPFLQYSMPSKLLASGMLNTKRFVFDSTALALLKSQQICSNLKSLGGPTRMEATTSIIWKAAAKAASVVRQFSPQSPHALLSAVNLRKRASPAMATNSIGNLILLTSAICFPESQLDLPTLMGELKQSIVKIDVDLIETIKGKKGHETFKELFKSLTHLANVTEVGDIMFATSILNTGIYELDFGWGKPIWFYVANEGVARVVILTDMLKGGGVEAIITLSRDEMEIFERDTELLSYAKVDPSPLLSLNS